MGKMIRVGLTLLVVMCIAFWNLPSAAATDYSGVWKGRWTTDASPNRNGLFGNQNPKNAHHGTVRFRLKPSGQPGVYRGVFSGRFAVVIPYVYRADVIQSGGSLYSQKRLGPLGSYQMRISGNSVGLEGRWSAGSSAGSISVLRVR